MEPVLGTAAGLAPAALAAEVGVIDLDLYFKDIALLALSHRLHQLVLDQPGARIAHAELALQCQRREPRLGLADQVDRQEPHREGELGAVKDGAGDERTLMAAGVALIQLAATASHHAVRRAPAVGTAKAFGPARRLKGRLTLGLGAESLEKLRHGQTRLELNSIHHHGGARRNQLGHRVRPQRARHVSLAYDHC